MSIFSSVIDPLRQSPLLSNSGAIDNSKVDAALRAIRADVPMNASQLANTLRSPYLNQDEDNLILQTLARENGEQLRFFANDVTRAGDDQYASLTSDQQVIADGLQRAYSAGAINKDDLLRIADTNTAGNGAQRFMSILEQGTSTREPNGICEVLADALWARNGNGELDRASAALFYTSDPSMMSRNLATPADRTAAFEALIDFNEKAPYASINAGLTATEWKTSALNAEGRLFTSYGQELIDHYTSASQTEVLAKFMSQTVFNPDAQGIWMDRRRDLIPAIRDTLGQAAQTYLDRAQQAPTDSLQQSRAMEQFGRLTASVSGGAAVALTAYDSEIMASDASKQEFAGFVSQLVGLTPLGALSDKTLGVGDKVIEALSNKLYDALSQNPDRPDAALAGALYDSYAHQADALSTQLNHDLRPAFDAGYAAELLNLQQNLNVNLGGHQQ